MNLTYDELELVISWIDLCKGLGDEWTPAEQKIEDDIRAEMKRLEDKYKDV